MKIGKAIVHIPARGGSKRVAAKNLRYIAGKPLLSYAIENAQACQEFDEIYVNTDSDKIASLSNSLGCEVYRRPKHLGADSATGEDFTYDIIKKKQPDTLIMLSPVCPLIDHFDIKEAIQLYNCMDVDTLISCSETRMQTFSNDVGINCDPTKPLAPTQVNNSIIICNWAVTIWNAETFVECYDKNKSGYFGKNRYFWRIDPIKAVKISEEKDFHLAESLLSIKGQSNKKYIDEPKYWDE